MKKVILMRGLPGSGKSTYAKKLVSDHPNSYKRINRDDLRAMFDNMTHSEGNEKFIQKVRDMLITMSLTEGKHVIVDDTNLSERTHTHISLLVKKWNKDNNDEVQLEVVEINTPLEESIRRDALREKPVGEKVIRNLHRQFMHTDPQYSVQDASLPHAILCDLDGTLALLNGRNPYDAKYCENDLLNEPVASVLKTFSRSGHQVILVSGRKAEHEPQTINWLNRHGVPFDGLYMRATQDNRKDSIVKRAIYDLNIRDKFFVSFILDDRNQVVDLWRKELGLPCFQVYYGDF